MELRLLSELCVPDLCWEHRWLSSYLWWDVGIGWGRSAGGVQEECCTMQYP